MICPSCGAENRPGARFCGQCGTSLDEEPAAQTYEMPASASDSPIRSSESSTASDAGPSDTVSKVGLFGGNGLITLGALIVLFAFMLPWASCGSMKVSGLDIVTHPSQYSETGGASGVVLALVPLGALALLAVAVIGVLVNLLDVSLPGSLDNLVPFLPLIGALPGLCGCCPSCGFLYKLQNVRSSPENYGLGMVIQFEYGFWLTLLGLGISFVGIIVALAGSLISRRRSSGPGPP